MTIAVIVPLSTELDAHRARAWQWIRCRYESEHPDWEIVPGYCDGAWCKAEAVADALTRTDADVFCIADADCWVDLPDACLVGGQLDVLFPHWQVIRLNEQATARVYSAGLPDAPSPSDLTQAAYVGKVGGGVVVVTRDLYERAPFDPRFLGWGREDEAFGRALLTLKRSHRHGDATLYHLFHEPQERQNRTQGSDANEQLWHRYRSAAGDVEAMRALIEEGRCCLRPSSPAP